MKGCVAVNENCKDCPYVEALDHRVGEMERKVDEISKTLNKVVTENEKTKIYYEKIIERIEDLKVLFNDKMFSFETRLEKLEKAFEEKNKNVFVKFSESPWSLKLLIYILTVLAGLRLIGFNVSKLLQ